MTIFKRCYKVWQNIIRRFQTGQNKRMVRTYIDENAGAKPIDLVVDLKSSSKSPAKSELDINRLDQRPENRSGYNDIPISSLRGNLKVRTNQDIDSTGFDSLEDYAEKLSINEETITKWVNAGILSPRETEEAEKLIRILREKRQDGHLTNTYFSTDP